MTLGQKIKKLRNEKGLTQKDLADQVHVTFQTVSKWEKDENEPDVSTLKELSKLFDVTVDQLVNGEELTASKENSNEVEPVVVPPVAVNKTVVIHQKELHVCRRCNKDIPENELVVEDFCVRPSGRGHAAEYRKDYYHKDCLEQTKKDREVAAALAKKAHGKKYKKLSFGWGIAGGVIALITSLLIFLIVPACKEAIHPGLAVLFAAIIGYATFAMLYCIISGSYIADVFLWCAGLSIKMPGIIFSWDIDGIVWAITMKVVFAIFGFFIGVLALGFAIALSAVLGAVSFPFVLVHNIHTDYIDA